MSPAFLLLACLAAVGEIFTDSAGLRVAMAVGLTGFIALEARQMSRVALILCGLCIALPAYELATGTFDWALAGRSVERAGFFAFFLTSLSFLQFAAARSPLILRSGEILVFQPPGRRYLVLTFGAAIFGILLNFSTLGLLGTMIAKGVAPGTTPEEQRISAIRKQRMTLAMLRGFSSLPMWSPITVTMALITAAIPQVSYGQIAVYSTPLAVAILLLGWGLDRFSHPRRALPNLPETPSLLGLAPLLGLVVAVPSLAFAVAQALSVSLIQALLLCLPLVSVGWLLIQTRSPRASATALGGELLPSWPNMRSEIGLFAASAFLGVLVLPLIDTVALGQAITALGLSGGAVLALSAWLAFVLSMVGVSPIISVTILAGTLPNLAGLRIDPVAVAIALTATWSIVVNVTPFSASVRLSARMIDADPARVGLRWNMAYGVAAMTTVSLFLLAFT
ncbi:hypothetical protein [Tropicibacter naphthalenivorans]|uniref:Uncharacterized protein n=1 Tax=Tropicibacter naphthalenivorans TaxID=441103 RepID=A0A0P1GGZ9_9RHOB|nr:hypothetical protein [Tropicibacter naphthalenivorans]CUH81120.1 hypothetical protein TRN7648_03324 [Tropicibacter naphthalenivorans]SMC97253.1 hypothetical protein SAMN04488093_10828 [Tropicibacter naphthalenivorans]